MIKNTILLLLLLSIIISCNRNKNKEVLANRQDSIRLSDQKLIDTTPVNNSRFGLIYPDNDSIFLLGKFPLNKEVVLVSNKRSKILKIKTIKYKVKFGYTLGTIIVTEVDKSLEKKLIQDFIYFDFASDYSNYKLIETKDTTNELFIDSLDSTIRSTSILDTLMNKNGSSEHERNALKKIKPIISKILIPDNEYYIATYKFYENAFGPRIISVNKKLFPLTGASSYPYFYVYSLGNEYFIESGSNGCGSGVTGVEIFKFDKDIAKLIFEDYSFSN